MKLLVIRFSSIGDIVLTTPVIRCLAQQLDAEVHFITKQAFVAILEPNPYIHQVIGIDTKTTPIKTVVPRLKKEQYDYIIDLHQNWRSWYLRSKLGIPSTGFQKLNFKKWLLTQFKINILPKVHIVARYLATTASLGINNDRQGLDYFIPKKDYLLSLEVSPLLLPNQYIAFVIGAAHFTKRLPKEKIVQICNQIPKPIVLIGGPAESEVAKWIIQQTTNKKVINSCGEYTLHQSAALVDQAQWVIAHDTGFMHIAAALRKPIISVWGSTVPDLGMTPYLPQEEAPSIIVENEDLACRPCDKIGKNECPKGHFNCMQAINIQEIVKACS